MFISYQTYYQNKNVIIHLEFILSHQLATDHLLVDNYCSKYQYYLLDQLICWQQIVK